MTITPKLPAGESLPEYDDEHPEGVDIEALTAWLRGHRNFRWGYTVDQAIIRDVLVALQAVGDATLVKNGTYRLMRRDGADIERLSAGLTRLGYAAKIIEYDGSVADAALSVARLANGLGDVVTEALRTVAENG